ncbi:MAG: hypothetical protein LBB89_00485 [Treponema sp.]|jgi:hypothetical protein|nr:hypothetical protein [Treponema sp.]
MNKKLAISYTISELSDNFSSKEILEINPYVVLGTENIYNPNAICHIDIFSLLNSVKIKKNPNIIDNFFRDKNKFFRKIQSDYRANQERVISDIICGIILRELRNEKDKSKHLVFFITHRFDTEKIVGRLAYLNLPLNRITILFISRDITDFYTRNIVSPFDYKFDLSYLMGKKEDNIYGPYPEYGTIGLLRTFYKTYSTEHFPLRIDLFCQGLGNIEIDTIKDKINNDFLKSGNVGQVKILNLKGKNFTYIPKVLCDCEEKIDQIQKDMNKEGL